MSKPPGSSNKPCRCHIQTKNQKLLANYIDLGGSKSFALQNMEIQTLGLNKHVNLMQGYVLALAGWWDLDVQVL